MEPLSSVCLFKSEKSNDAYRSLFETAGYTVFFAPVLAFEFVNQDLLLAKLLGRDSGPYDALIATSARSLEAIRALLERSDNATQQEIREQWKSKVLFSVGAATSAASPLEFSAVYSSNCDGAHLAQCILAHYEPISMESKPVNLLFLCSEIRRDVLPDELSHEKHRHLNLHELVVYSTKGVELTALEEAQDAQWWIFFSPSGVDSMLSQFGGTLSECDKRFAAIGKTTAEALDRAGVKHFAVAEKPTPESLLASMTRFSP